MATSLSGHRVTTARSAATIGERPRDESLVQPLPHAEISGCAYAGARNFVMRLACINEAANTVPWRCNTSVELRYQAFLWQVATSVTARYLKTSLNYHLIAGRVGPASGLQAVHTRKPRTCQKSGSPSQFTDSAAPNGLCVMN
jgi:hypothetical protein